MTDKKIFIGIPVHGDVMVSTVISLISTIVDVHGRGWGFPQVYFRVGDSDLCRARNAIISKFYEGDWTDLVMVDSDISWNAADLSRLVSHKKDFVAGAYRGRTDEKQLYFIHWPEQKEMWMDPDTGLPLLKVDATTIGFCRLTRACVEKLVKSLDGDYLIDPMFPDEKVHWLIDFERSNGIRYEEGFSLCRRWRELGGDVWVDPAINLGHMGPKVFDSNLMGFLEDMRNRMETMEASKIPDFLADQLSPQFEIEKVA